MANDVDCKVSTASAEVEKREWLDRLSRLVADIENWAKQLDWSTRRIEKRMRDSRLGAYSAPAVIMQRETHRCLLEPVSNQAPDVDGVVDLYLLPAYDDIASFRYSDGQWRLYYTSQIDLQMADPLLGDPREVSKEALGMVLEAMTKHAA
jgi:hypothetical protein